jgi:aryl-alcohol dehydrogenase-like predicted oxidoreductase
MSSEKMERRKFLKRMSSALLGAAAAPLLPGLRSLTAAEKAAPVEYRTLGKTGLKVTAVSMGVMNCSDPAVLHRAFDLGINFYDTADCYMRGNNEEMVGKVFEGRRSKVQLQTKVHPGDEKKMRASVERSLRRLRTDYLDVLVWHGHHKPEEVSDPGLFEFMGKMKKEGKVRFTGFSAHSNMAALLREAAKSGGHDVALVSYNFTHSKGLKEAIAVAAGAGIGIVAMKTQAGGYKKGKMAGLTPHQAALRYVLTDSNVATAVPGVTSVEQIEECAAAMKTSFSEQNLLQLKQYRAFLDGRICTLCGGCTGECPNGVAYGDVLRLVMYHDGYENDLLVKEASRGLANLAQTERCLDCSSCLVQCRRGIDIRGKIQVARSILSGVHTTDGSYQA